MIRDDRNVKTAKSSDTRTTINCRNKSRCIECSKNHHADECVKHCNYPAKSVLCTKYPAAKHKGCSAFKSAFKKSTPKALQSRFPILTLNRKTKSYSEATNSQNARTERINSDILLHLISNLNSLISPLIRIYL